MDILIKNGLITTAEGSYPADVAIDGEIISQIGQDLSAGEGARVIDLKGARLMPGGIDAHTHFDMELGAARTSDDFHTGTRAALAGGVTTIIDFAEQDAGRPLAEGLCAWRAKAGGRSFCDYAFHMTINHWDDSLPGQMAEMVQQGLTSFKVYTAYRGMRISDQAIYQVLTEARKLGALVLVHCENGDLIEALTEKYLAEAPENPAGHARSRPAELEAEAVSRVIDIARLAGTGVYIVHLSSAQSLERVRYHRQNGAEVLVETCPQYLLLDETRYDGPEALNYIMSPPLRRKADNEALWTALKNSEIQVVSTDHCSFARSGLKNSRVKFTDLPGGIPSVEHRLPLLYSYGVKTGRLSPEKFVELVSTNPAKIFGLFPQKGCIAPGGQADLTVLRELPPEAGLTISATSQFQSVDYTPYEGFPLAVRVDKVFLRGQCVFDQGAFQADPAGRFLPRSPRR